MLDAMNLGPPATRLPSLCSVASVAVLAVLHGTPRSTGAAIHHVAADGSGDFLAVQAGIDAAAAGDTLRIAPGTYEEHLLIDGKDLLLEGTTGAEVTFLDGQYSGRVLTVLSAPGGVTLRGLTIQHGVMSGVEINDQGGGVAAFLTALTVEDCVFQDNGASSRGAGLVVGIFAPPGSPGTVASAAGIPSLTVSRTLFLNNLCGGSGGGIHCDEVPSLLVDCTFIGNHAGGTGGGVDLLQQGHRMEHCVFQGNSGFLGAGVAMVGDGVLSLTDVVFQDNVSDNFGGGLWSVNGGGVVLEQVRFLRNQADRGGGLYLARVPLLASRVLFRGNHAVDRGGGVYFDQVSSALLDHSTWIENTAPRGTSLWAYAGTLSFTACILGDEDGSAVECSSGTTVSSSCTVGGLGTGYCVDFAARRSIVPCEGSPELLCTVPSPGSCGPVGYAEALCPAPSCGTPARPATWGGIKALYRP